jgi:hypothetical protein
MAKGKKTGGRAAGTPNKAKVGRPSLYCDALAETLCERIARGNIERGLRFSRMAT